MRYGLAILLLTAAAAGGARAQEAPETVPYRVHRGDTLAGIARAYLRQPADAGAVARANGLAAGWRLRPGATIAIPRAALRATPLRARVIAFRGGVLLGGGAQAQIGTLLPEGTRIETWPNASISLRLEDGSIVTLPSRSVLRIVRLRRVALTGAIERLFRLEQGRSTYSVTHLRGPGDTFQVQTPVSIAAVRGTEFRVALPGEPGAGADAATAEVLAGNVGVSGRSGTIGLPVGFGARSEAASTGTPVPLLPAPVLLPTIGLRPDGTQIVGFTPVPGAVAYRVVLAYDAGFTDLAGDASATKPSVTLPPLAYGRFYVRATAIDAQGLEGFPATYPYEHRAVAPAAPTPTPPPAPAGTPTTR